MQGAENEQSPIPSETKPRKVLETDRESPRRSECSVLGLVALAVASEAVSGAVGVGHDR